MSRMTSTALAWWEGRTLREQRMLAAMAVLVVAVLVWLAVVRPLHVWRETAASNRLRAENGLLLVRAATATLSGETSGDDVDIQRVVEAASTAAGVSPVMGMAPDGGLGFSLADVQTAAAFGWLSALHDKGVNVASLSVVENTDATLTLEGSLTAN